jgi:hypothetical protein
MCVLLGRGDVRVDTNPGARENGHNAAPNDILK